MENTIYLDFEENEVPINVYSVKLASQNPSDGYGIWDMTSQSVKVDWGTVVNPSPTGTYSYTLSVENGRMYLVSWEITANEGESPTYKTDQIGPFFSVTDNDVRAVATYSGKFVQGSRATMMLKVTNFDGIAVDAEEISIAIYNEDGITVSLDNTTPEFVTTGYYVYDWVVPDDQPNGEYTIVWSYIVDDIDKAEVQYVVVSEDAEDTLLYSGRFLEFRMALEYHLSCAQSIPVYYEQAKPSRDNKTFRFTFKNWNQSADVKVYRNGKVVNEGVEVDFFNGKITFDETLAIQETVNCDYNFKWFKDEELNRFLNNAVQMINSFPPMTPYTIESVADRYIPAILYGAAKDALRQLMMCIQFQQPAQIFGGMEGAKSAFQGFDTLKQNFEKDWDKIIEAKRYGPYPSVRLISVPTHTLPGGRSICPDMTSTYFIDNNIFTYTLEEAYNLFRTGVHIQILSHSDLTGKLIFSPVDHIWESGIKSVYELKTMNGYSVRTSDEHLFFVNGNYMPLRDIRIGDRVITSDNNSIEDSRVKSIKKLRIKERMLDLEVFGAKNLFSNGIKCHNSRWFRMLFK